MCAHHLNHLMLDAHSIVFWVYSRSIWALTQYITKRVAIAIGMPANVEIFKLPSSKLTLTSESGISQ